MRSHSSRLTRVPDASRHGLPCWPPARGHPVAWLPPGWLRSSTASGCSPSGAGPPRRHLAGADGGRPASSTCTCTAGAGRRSTAVDPEAAATVVRHPPRPRHHDDGGQPGHRLAGRLAASCDALASLADDGLVAGIHLEGPWLSPRRAGAHDRSQLVDPTAAGGRPAGRRRRRPPADGHARAGAARLRCRRSRAGRRGVVAAVGHTDATYDETRAALDAGATAGTHLFNAMPPLHHRQPGPVAALLESSAYLELVADGVHVHPAVLALAWRPGRTASGHRRHGGRRRGRR